MEWLIESPFTSQEDRVKNEVVKLASRLASLVNAATLKVPHDFLVLSSEMRALAAGINGLVGATDPVGLRKGRVFDHDLVVGGRYVAKGWSLGEFTWTFKGRVPNDASAIVIQRVGQEPTVERVGDHGLSSYDSLAEGQFWHPTNWTEGTGSSEEMDRKIMDALENPAMGNVEIDLGGGEDELS